MTIQEFEQELRLIDKDLSIRPNNPNKRVAEMFPDVLKMASIIYKGSELCTIPNYDIYDEPNGSYGVDIRGDGRFIRHRTRPEALQIVKDTLERMKNDKDYHDSFLGIGEYSEAELRKKDETPTVEIVDEVSAELKPITGGMIEGKTEGAK